MSLPTLFVCKSLGYSLFQKKKDKQTQNIPFMQGADNKTYNKEYRQHSSHGETSDFQLWKQYYQVLFI